MIKHISLKICTLFNTAPLSNWTRAQQMHKQVQVVNFWTPVDPHTHLHLRFSIQKYFSNVSVNYSGNPASTWMFFAALILNIQKKLQLGKLNYLLGSTKQPIQEHLLFSLALIGCTFKNEANGAFDPNKFHASKMCPTLQVRHVTLKTSKPTRLCWLSLQDR